VIKYYGVVSKDIIHSLRELQKSELVEIERVGKVSYVKPCKTLRDLITRREVQDTIIGILLRRLLSSERRDVYQELIQRIGIFIRKLIEKFKDNINEFNLEFERNIGLYIRYAFLDEDLEKVLEMRRAILDRLGK